MMVKYFPDYGYTATLLTDGRVLFLGSNDWPDPADAEVYDPAAGTFASIGGAVSQELAPASRLTDGTVLIAGGQVPGGNGSTDAELYVPASGTFENVGEMTTARHSHTATPLPDDTVLITGGFSVGRIRRPAPKFINLDNLRAAQTLAWRSPMKTIRAATTIRAASGIAGLFLWILSRTER